MLDGSRAVIFRKERRFPIPTTANATVTRPRSVRGTCT
jgi:hypothetical protein